MLFALPESEDDSALRCRPALAEGFHYLQDSTHAGGIVVRSVVDVVAFNIRIHPFVVEMRPHYDTFVTPFARDYAQDVAQSHALMHSFLYLIDGVGMHKEAHATLQSLLGAGFKGLLITVLEPRPYAQLAHLRNDVLFGNVRTAFSGTASLEQIVGEKIDVGPRRILADAA